MAYCRYYKIIINNATTYYGEYGANRYTYKETIFSTDSRTVRLGRQVLHNDIVAVILSVEERIHCLYDNRSVAVTARWGKIIKCDCSVKCGFNIRAHHR